MAATAMAKSLRVCVCTAQALFMRGGAEQHVENLATALRQAGHEVDTVRLPVAWHRDHLLPSALAWRFLEVTADVVIATNFPSYFIRHPRKVVWLFHQHRAAYDAVDTAWSDLDLSETSLSTQQMLTDWDSRVLEEAVALFSTSREVADRLARFNGLTATPLYHPAPLQTLLTAGGYGDYLFCASRLEANKRLELAIRALSTTTSRLRLVIAGEGSRRGHLQRLARELGVGDRVDLLGYVSEERLIELFANARAVIYVPHAEDYGYVTLQAFAAKRPVVTTTDSGGVLEWVVEGVNGFIAPPDPAALGGVIDRVAEADDARLRRMGELGHERVHELRWEPVVETLMASARR